MKDLLVRMFVKDREDVKNPDVRRAYGTLASIFGIISNLIICAMKFVVGIVFGIISITADAVNNLADASSSVVSLIGIKLSAKPADKKQPFGYARIEYIAGFIISILVAALGLILIKDSINAIIEVAKLNNVERLENTEFVITIIVLLVAIGLKVYQALFNFSVGKKINSTTLKATAIDSRNDVLATSVVLIGTIVAHFVVIPNVSIDGILGCFVGVFIAISGYKLIKETAHPLLGELPDKEVVNDLMELIKSYDIVLGVHDLQIHSYGPSCLFASCHVEVDGSNDIFKIHDEIDNIETKCLEQVKVHTVLHMDPVVVNNPKQNKLKEEVGKVIKELPYKADFHDFRMVEGPTHTNLVFDILVEPGAKAKDEEIVEKVSRKMKEIDEKYICVLTIDRDYTGYLEKK